MSELAVKGFRAERDSILNVAKSLTDEEWTRPSACAGWSTRDVMGHMACTLHGVVDPTVLPDRSQATERSAEPTVIERRSWPIEAVVDEYATYGVRAADVFASLQTGSRADRLISMGDFGTHPMSILPSLYLFDAYTHLRNDILAPSGPIDRVDPPRDEMRLRPTVEWMLAQLPWMCEAALAPVVDRPLTLILDGPGGGTWTIAAGGDDGRVSVTEGAVGDPAATVAGTDHDFAMWGTKRAPWRGLVKVEGDESYAARVLDAVQLYELRN